MCEAAEPPEGPTTVCVLLFVDKCTSLLEFL